VSLDTVSNLMDLVDLTGKGSSRRRCQGHRACSPESCLETQQIDCIEEKSLKALGELTKLASYLVNAQGFVARPPFSGVISAADQFQHELSTGQAN